MSGRPPSAVAWCGQMATLPDRHEIEADTGHADGGPVFLQRLIPRLLNVCNVSPKLTKKGEVGACMPASKSMFVRVDSLPRPAF